MIRKMFFLVVISAVIGIAASGSYPTLRDGYGWSTSVSTNNIWGRAIVALTNRNFLADEHGTFVMVPYRWGLDGLVHININASNTWARKTLYFTLANADPIYFSKTFRWYIADTMGGKSDVNFMMYYKVSGTFFVGEGVYVSPFPTGSYFVAKHKSISSNDYFDILVEGFTTQSTVTIEFGPFEPDDKVANTTNISTKCYIFHEAGY